MFVNYRVMNRVQYSENQIEPFQSFSVQKEKLSEKNLYEQLPLLSTQDSTCTNIDTLLLHGLEVETTVDAPCCTI